HFSGDIEGDGAVEFLQAARADGSASFVGIERVTGTVTDKEGTFLFQDSGTVENNIVNGAWFVVPGSGTGGVGGRWWRGRGGGLGGRGGLRGKLGKGARVYLDLWFE